MSFIKLHEYSQAQNNFNNNMDFSKPQTLRLQSDDHFDPVAPSIDLNCSVKQHLSPCCSCQPSILTSDFPSTTESAVFMAPTGLTVLLRMSAHSLAG